MPVHKVHLSCELVQGEVEVGVRQELPVEGIDIVLGNDLVGCVWPDDVRPNSVHLPDQPI